MKRNVIIKLFIDIAMLVLYILLMFAKGLGGFFHETVGIGIGIVFVIHILMNISMTKGLLKSLKGGKFSKKLLLFSDIALTICMPIVIVTGILIAKELFVVKTGISWTLLFDLHNVLSFVCLGIMALHILLHAKYLVGVFKKIPSSFSGAEMRSAALRFVTGAAAAAFIYSFLAFYKNVFADQSAPKIHSLGSASKPVPTASKPVSTASKAAAGESSASNPTAIDEDDSATDDIESEQSITSAEETLSTPPTLEEYLSGLRCTGCGRACFLLNPRCGKGQAQASRAAEEYNRLYIG